MSRRAEREARRREDRLRRREMLFASLTARNVGDALNTPQAALVVACVMGVFVFLAWWF